MNDLKRTMNNLNQEERKKISEILRDLADQVERPMAAGEGNAARIAELEEANAALNERLENAKEYFKKIKSDAEMAETRSKAVLARNLQKSRDEIYTLGTALHTYAEELAKKASSKMTLVQVNNLQAGLETIISNLMENGLWNPEADLKPELSQVEKTKTPKKPRRKKETETEEAVQIEMSETSGD